MICNYLAQVVLNVCVCVLLRLPFQVLACLLADLVSPLGTHSACDRFGLGPHIHTQLQICVYVSVCVCWYLLNTLFLLLVSTACTYGACLLMTLLLLL